jgi:acyl carrier protein
VAAELRGAEHWGNEGRLVSTQPTTLADRGADDPQALHASVHATVVQIIIEVVGEEFYEEAEIGLDSTFAEDIDLESMEVMEISERLMDHFGEKVDFVGWFAEMELEDLVTLTLGMVVDFIVAALEDG